jgi:serine/threonine-protein kinase
VEIARQLCAGLAAAHDSGVLHRDLKPANIMIDGRGKVRVTDFGLAGLAEGFRGDEVMAGTPAYMAPEQLAGKAVTVKSDIYALGLVLYEVFTGKRAFQAGSIAELLRLQEQTTPASPSSLASDIDPLVERVILRCLERDPDNRPASALQIAAARWRSAASCAGRRRDAVAGDGGRRIHGGQSSASRRRRLPRRCLGRADPHRAAFGAGHAASLGAA